MAPEIIPQDEALPKNLSFSENASANTGPEPKTTAFPPNTSTARKVDSLSIAAPQEAPDQPIENLTIDPAQTKSDKLVSSSAGSKLSAATTSTRRPDEIPFEQFEPQIRELCDKLWPRSTSKISSLLPHKDANKFSFMRVLSRSGSQLGKSLRSRGGPRVLPHANRPREFAVERMKGGSYNRVVGITLPSSINSPESQYVLRIPRSEWHDPRPDRDVAVLRYVRKHSTIPVAEIKACDFTESNPIKHPYVMQTRIRGSNLQEAYSKGLKDEQWIDAARQIGHIMREMQAVRHPFPGRIETDTKSGTGDDFIVRSFDVKSLFDPNPILDNETWSQEHTEKIYSDTQHFLGTQYARWRVSELQQDPHYIFYPDRWKGLADVAEAMDIMGYLGDKPGDNQNCLCHLDFRGRNIMVDIQPDDSLKVTGVLDWDSAVFAPRFVGCCPPHWMWADEDDEDDEDFDEDDESKADQIPKREIDRRVKEAWEEAAGEEVLRYAYEPYFRIARKLFHAAIHGMHSSWELRGADNLIKEWNTFYQEYHERIAAYERELNEGFDSESGSEVYKETQESHEPGVSAQLKK